MGTAFPEQKRDGAGSAQAGLSCRESLTMEDKALLHP